MNWDRRRSEFSLLLMGSEGRREQTFATDQDNALIFENCEVDFLEQAAEIFFQPLPNAWSDILIQWGFRGVRAT